MPRDRSTLGPDAARVAAAEARDRAPVRPVPLDRALLRRQAIADAVAGYEVGYAPTRHRLTVWEADEIARRVLTALEEEEEEFGDEEDDVDSVEAYWRHRDAMDDARAELRGDR